MQNADCSFCLPGLERRTYQCDSFDICGRFLIDIKRADATWMQRRPYGLGDRDHSNVDMFASIYETMKVFALFVFGLLVPAASQVLILFFFLLK